MCSNSHLLAKGLTHTRMQNKTECRPQKKRSCTTLLSISTPTKANEAHCNDTSGRGKQTLVKTSDDYTV